MSNPKPDNLDQLLDDEMLEMLSNMNVDQWLETLRHADRSFYNLMALEVWSIAKTMDSLIPGFWSRFMANRQVALKQFMEQKQQAANGVNPTE
jgi:hypothetical protein